MLCEVGGGGFYQVERNGNSTRVKLLVRQVQGDSKTEIGGCTFAHAPLLQKFDETLTRIIREMYLAPMAGTCCSELNEEGLPVCARRC